MSVNNSVIHSNNGTLTDISKSVLKYASGTSAIADWVAAQDYLYLGSRAPFNHAYFKLSVVSATASNVMTVQYWDGREWRDAHRVEDETSGFTASGFVTFYPDKRYSWEQESTNDQNETVTGLTTVNVYDLYWMRIKFSLDIPAGFTLAWAGQKFSDDDDLNAEFPDLVRANMLLAFGTGKTSWEEQHVKAAELTALDLIASEVVDWSGQILVREEFTLAAVMKVAEMIYGALGDDYVDQRDRAAREYKSRLDKSVYRVDKNQNAILDKGEDTQRVGFMTR